MREYRRDLTGRHFGAWRVVRRALDGANGKHARWLCRCSCGKTKDVRGDTLAQGRSASCGCHAADGW